LSSACRQDDPSDATDFATVSFGPDGTQLAYSGSNSTEGNQATGSVLCVMDVSPVNMNSDSQAAASIQTGFGSLSLSYTSDGALFHGGTDGTVRLWRVPQPQIGGLTVADTDMWDTTGDILAAPIEAPDGQGSTSFGLWNLAAPNAPALRARVPLATRMLSFISPTELLTVAEDGAVQLWNVADPAHPVPAASLGSVAIAPLQHWAANAEVSAVSDRNLVSVLGADGRVHLWRITTNPLSAKESGSIPAPTGPPAALIGDGHTVMITTSSGFTWWNVTDPDHPTLGGSSSQPGANTSSAGSVGDLVVSESAATDHGTSSLRLFTVTNGKPTGAATVTNSAGSSFDMSADGHLLALTESGDTALDLWDVASPGDPKRLSRFAVPGIEGLALGPTKATVAVWNASTLQLWDISSPTRPALKADITLPEQAIRSGDSIGFATFAQNGRKVLVSTADSIFVFDADPASLAKDVCRSVGPPLSASQWSKYAPGLPHQMAC